MFVPCFVVHFCVRSSFAIILTWKRVLDTLFRFSSWCLVIVIDTWLFLTVSWVGLNK